jgi:hypothetical protein
MKKLPCKTLGVFLLMALSLAGCNAGPTGTYIYRPEMPKVPGANSALQQIAQVQEQRLELRGNKATLWMVGVGQEFQCSQTGNVITLKHPSGQILRLTIQKDGSLSTGYATYKPIR